MKKEKNTIKKSYFFREAERIEKNRFYAYFAYPCIPAFKAYLLLLLEKLDLRFVFLDMAGLFRGAAIPACIIHTGQYRVKGKFILDKKGI